MSWQALNESAFSSEHVLRLSADMSPSGQFDISDGYVNFLPGACC